MIINQKILFSCIVLLIIGCQPEKIETENVVARVNGAYITFEELLAKIPEGTGEQLQKALMRQLMEQWVEDEIFYQTALNENMQLSPSQLKLIKEYERGLLIQLYIENRISKPYRILDKEIEDYYNQHKDEFKWNEDNTHIIHLIIENRENKIFSEIRKSKDLMEIINSYFFEMQSTPARPIGDLGYVKVSDLPDRIVKKIKEMRTGAISNPLKLSDGYHFIQLLDFQKTGNQQNLDIVKDEIILRLKMSHRKQELAKIEKELRINFKIETNTSKLTNY